MTPDDDSAHLDGGRGPFGLLDDLIMALRFFSRLPTGKTAHERPDLGRIAVVLPFASLVIGVLPVAMLAAGMALGLPGYFAASLAVGTMVVVGGGMMEDAIADAADGLFGGSTPQRRLEILKDSRHGTYGVAALCLFLLLRITALGSLAEVDPFAAAALWLAANCAGRSGGLWLAVALPLARQDGAAATAGTLSLSRFALGAVIALLLVFALSAWTAGLLGAAIAIVFLTLMILGWAALCRRLVGGQTGDLVGAAGALGEIAMLTVLLIFA